MNSRKIPLTLTIVAAALLSACTSGSLSSLTLNSNDVPYFMDAKIVTVDTDYIERYGCARQATLVCKHTGRVSSSALCQCL